MEIIDINASFGYQPDEILPKRTPEQMLERMDTAGVTSCVAYATRAIIQFAEGNAETLAVSASSGGRIAPCLVLHPYMDGIQMPKADDLSALLRRVRPAAVRIFPSQHKYLLTEFYCGELMEVLQQLRIPVMLNLKGKSGVDRDLPELSARFPQIPFVLMDADHGTSLQSRMLLQKRKNIYLNVGFMDGVAELDQLVRDFGAERFLFGSSAGCISDGALGMVYYGRFPQEAKQAILAGNWKRLQEGIQWKS